MASILNKQETCHLYIHLGTLFNAVENQKPYGIRNHLLRTKEHAVSHFTPVEGFCVGDRFQNAFSFPLYFKKPIIYITEANEKCLIT